VLFGGIVWKQHPEAAIFLRKIRSGAVIFRRKIVAWGAGLGYTLSGVLKG
jgi:hypothetical protein